MKIVQSLCGVALAPFVNSITQSPGYDAPPGDASAGARAIGKQLRALGPPLADGLQRALERSWLALEIALDRLAWNQRLPGLADRALAAQLQAFLETQPLPELEGKARFRQLALEDLRKARRGGQLFPGPLTIDHVAVLGGTLVRFTDPQTSAEGERMLMKLLADEVKAAGFGNLSWVLAQRPAQGEPLLSAAARSYFRHEVEDNDHLFRALRPQGRQGLDEAREAGFAALGEAFAHQGDRLASLLDNPPEIAPAPAAAPLLALPPSPPPPARRAVEPLAVEPIPVLEVVPVEVEEPRGTYALADDDRRRGREDDRRGRRDSDYDEEEDDRRDGRGYDEDESLLRDRRNRRERPEPRFVPFHPIDFQARVEEDSAGKLEGTLAGRIRPGALVLWIGDKKLEVPVGTEASAEGRRLQLEIDGRTLAFNVSASRNSGRLAEDVAAYLREDKDRLEPKAYKLPTFLFPLLVTLGTVLLFVLMIVARIVYSLRQPPDPPAQAAVASPMPMPMPAPGMPNPIPNPGGRPPVVPMAAQMRYATNVLPFSSLAADDRARAAFGTSNTGVLFHYTYPEFQRRGFYRLNKLTAYQSVLDGRAGMLYCAMAAPRSVRGHAGRHRERGLGDVHVYDVNPILRGTADRFTPLEPVATLAADVVVGNMHLSPDGRWLYFLNVKDRTNVRLVRIATATRATDDLRLANGMEVLRLTPDGSTLVASTSSGSREEDLRGPGLPAQLQVIDANRFIVERTFRMPRDVYDMDVSNDNRAYCTCTGAASEVLAIDLKTGAVLARWGGISGSSFVRASPNGKRLYLLPQFAGTNALDCWALPDRLADEPRKGLAVPFGNPSREMILTPDGKRLVFKSGAVYELLGGT